MRNFKDTDLIPMYLTLHLWIGMIHQEDASIINATDTLGVALRAFTS